MSGNPYPLQGDWPSWVREHRVCWELAAFREKVKNKGLLQTGYALKLCGSFAPSAQQDPEAVAGSIYERLRTLAAEVIQSMPMSPLVQVEPPGRAIVSTGSPLVEVELTVVASPPRSSDPLPAPELRRLIKVVEDRLRAMGVSDKKMSARRASTSRR